MFRKNQEASLLDLDSGSSVNLLKQAPPLLETAQDAHQPEFDQILDLTNNSDEDGGDNLLAPPPLATPLIAFEDSINTSPKQEVPTAGKFLIILDLFKHYLALFLFLSVSLSNSVRLMIFQSFINNIKLGT